MDESRRCRRTDGKRWRCSKEVILNEKYCEKHIHRGCRRSRKLVESTIAKPSYSNRASNVLHLNSLDGSCPASKVPLNAKLKIEDNSGKDQKIKDYEDQRRDDGMTKITFKPSSFVFTGGKMENMEKQHKQGKDNGCDYERVKGDKCSNGNVYVKTESENMKSKKSDAMGLDFSPKSVLGEGDSFPAVNTQSEVTNKMEAHRCRRTDGKKWRCRKEVIADDQKYCAKHMHRGSKKCKVSPHQVESENPFALVKRANKVVVGFDTKISSSTETQLSFIRR